eukprot:jgi/Ulvmu1/11918/UM081_0078.1
MGHCGVGLPHAEVEAGNSVESSQHASDARGIGTSPLRLSMDSLATNHAAFNALTDHLKCPVCKEMLREPYVTGCGHTFCHDCIHHHLEETSQKCPSCGHFVVSSQVKPVYAMDKVLTSIRELVSANVQSNAKELGSFLGSTPIIRSSTEIDGLLSVLSNRRSELQISQLTGQLQLLQLFLEHAKQVKELELAAANQQLACVEADLTAIGSPAAAPGVRGASQAQSPPGEPPFLVGRNGAPGGSLDGGGGAPRHPNLAGPPAHSSAPGALQAGHPPAGLAGGGVADARGLDGMSGDGAADPVGAGAEAAHLRLMQSKEARMHAHFEELQEQYLAQCGVGDAAGGLEDVLPGAVGARRTGGSRGKRGRGTAAGVGAGSRGPLRHISQDGDVIHGHSSNGQRPPGPVIHATTAGQRASERLLYVGDVLQAATQYTQLRSVLEMLPSQPGRQRAVTGIAFSCDGRVLAKGGASMHIRLHNFESVLSSGTLVHMPMAEIPVTTRVTELACSPLDPAQVLSAGDSTGAIDLWDISNAPASANLPHPPAVPTTTATGGPTSTSSSSAAAQTTHSGASGVAAAATTPLRVFGGHTNRVWSLSYSALRPTVFVSGSDDCTVRLWDTKQHKHAWVADLGANVCGVAFSPWDEHIVACGTAAHSISVFDVRNNKTPLSSVQGLGKTVAYVRFVSRSELVASSVNSSLSLWSWEPMERLRTFAGHVNVRNFVGMETSGDYIACGSETSQVHVFCKYLSQPILSHTLTPARMPPSTSYFTLTTAWKPNSTYLLASLSTGSCHILSMGSEDT